MKMQPLYNELIIVGVTYNNNFKWYVTDKEIWYLDYNKLDHAYGANYNLQEPEERRNLRVLDGNNVQDFLDNVKQYECSTEELRLGVKAKRKVIEDADDILDFSPSLYVNFDKKFLISLFPEPASFEDYVPKGWRGEYGDFTKDIPVQDIFWMENNKNLLDIGVL